MPKHYRIFGLTITSALPLLAPTFNLAATAAPDVVIDYGDVPFELSSPQVAGVRFQAAPGEFLLRVDDIARFHVRDGNRITITPENDTRGEDILPFLMGSAFGALLQQRKTLVLHGSAIEVNGESVVFCGPSGIGKSTLAAGFHQRGYPFLADDLCAIAICDGRPAVIPGFPRLKLWADTLKKLDTCKDQLQSVRLGTVLEKYFLPVDACQHALVPLHEVFILESANSEKLSITLLQGTEKIDPLIENTYRMRFLHGLGGKKDHFKQCAEVAAKVDVCQVVRPDKGFLLSELMDMVAESFPS